jgi:hypothetical protein
MRILLARTDRIGDLILSTPAIATVRRSFPQAHVSMVTSTYNRVVMERNDDVDELVSLDVPAGASRLGETLRGYDVAIALAPRIVDLRIIGATHAPRRIGYTYRRRWFARLTAPLYVDTLMLSEADPALSERDPQRRVRHEVDQLLDLVALAGAGERVARLRLDVRDEDRAALAGLPENPVVMHLGLRWFLAPARKPRPSDRRDVPRGEPRVRRGAGAAGGSVHGAARAAVLRLGSGIRASGVHRDGRHRSDTRRKRGAQADRRRLRTPVFRAQQPRMGAV